ncbi:ArsC/Spx/MgsR family protein [Paenibacillus durus]|uniref:Nitrogenase-associated protein n=1 Tax=Paenibacillus durus ATCC 35681 TaxID=1333534 RepID=A0A0F7CK55_PAEDU|nr:ArsC/Spx/MgsR family protein [Paenibacillus durus]AKG37071.1 nitrogenase-associated protein [Paenibacillus durus ATCC 35681]
MAHIIFYTKPGCMGAARQKALLESNGHTLEERSLLSTEWTPKTLQPYLADLELKDWFNPNAPAVKSGQVIPGALSREETLELLCSNPILIKRPLMNIGDQVLAGFDAEHLKRIGLCEVPSGYNTGCHSQDQGGACASGS